MIRRGTGVVHKFTLFYPVAKPTHLPAGSRPGIPDALRNQGGKTRIQFPEQSYGDRLQAQRACTVKEEMCRWRAVAQGWKSSIRSSSRGRGSWRTTGATGPLGAGAMFSGGTAVRPRACCGGQIGASCSVYDEVDGVRLTDLPPPEVEDPGNTQWNRVPCRIRLEPVRSTPHWEDARPELAGPGLGENTWEAYNAARQVFAPAPQGGEPAGRLARLEPGPGVALVSGMRPAHAADLAAGLRA